MHNKKLLLVPVIALALLLSGAGAAYATHTNVSQGENHCTTRSSVSQDEVEDLLNDPNANRHVTQSAPYESGQQLSLEEPESAAGDVALVCTFALVKFVTNLLFVFLVVIAVLLIAIAAFMFVTAAGNPEKVSKAKTLLVWAIIGLVVAALARAVPAIVKGVIGL